MGTTRTFTALAIGALTLGVLAVAPPASAGPEGYALTNAWDAVANKDVAAAPDGTVWSVDGFTTMNHFSATGTLLGSFTLDGLAHAKGITVGPDGTLYVTDSDSGGPDVVAFSPDGTALRDYTLIDGAYALGADVAPTGEVLITNASSDRVEVFSADGTWLRNIGSSGAGVGQVDRPDDVVVSADGSVYVSDYWNYRVQKFSLATGAYLGTFGQPGRGPGQLDTPYAVDLTPAGAFVSRTEHGLSMLYDDQGLSVDAAGAIYATRLQGLARFAPATPKPPPITQPPVPQPPAIGTVALANRKIPVSGKRGTLTLSCTGGTTCQGKVKLAGSIKGSKKKGTYASGKYSLYAGTGTLKVTLTRKARVLLKKKSAVSAQVTLTPGATGKATTTKAKLVRSRKS